MRWSSRRSPEVLPDLGQNRGTELAVARLHADRDAAQVGPQRGEQQTQAIGHRHAPAVQRIGLDRVDHLGRSHAAHQDDAEAEDQAAERRHPQRAADLDADSGTQRMAAGNAEDDAMGEIDGLMQAGG
jgi:hypothetical protein